MLQKELREEVKDTANIRRILGTLILKKTNNRKGRAVVSNNWQKHKDKDKIWRYSGHEPVMEFIFSFDKKSVYSLFRDYPWNLTPEQKAIFDKENPYWAEFFEWRNHVKNPYDQD